MSWSLSQLLAGLHDDIEQRLKTSRKTLGHPVTKGDASENVWIGETNRRIAASNFQERRQLIVRAHDETFSVAASINNNNVATDQLRQA